MDEKYKKPKGKKIPAVSFKPSGVTNVHVMNAADDALLRELHKMRQSCIDAVAYARTAHKTFVIADIQAAQRNIEYAIRRRESKLTRMDRAIKAATVWPGGED